MQNFWQEELTAEEETELIEKVAQSIHKRKMETPAILFFEMHKPLASMAGQTMVVFSPFITPFVGFDKVNDYSRILGNRKTVEKLILRLEDLREQPHGGNEDINAMA